MKLIKKLTISTIMFICFAINASECPNQTKTNTSHENFTNKPFDIRIPQFNKSLQGYNRFKLRNKNSKIYSHESSLNKLRKAFKTAQLKNDVDQFTTYLQKIHSKEVFVKLLDAINNSPNTTPHNSPEASSPKTTKPFFVYDPTTATYQIASQASSSVSLPSCKVEDIDKANECKPKTQEVSASLVDHNNSHKPFTYFPPMDANAKTSHNPLGVIGSPIKSVNSQGVIIKKFPDISEPYIEFVTIDGYRIEFEASDREYIDKIKGLPKKGVENSCADCSTNRKKAHHIEMSMRKGENDDMLATLKRLEDNLKQPSRSMSSSPLTQTSPTSVVDSCGTMFYKNVA